MKISQQHLHTLLLLAGMGFASTAPAALVPQLNGAVVYDTDRNITWLANANLAATNNFGVGGISGGTMDWNTAQNWVAAMNAAHYLGFNTWRLPTTLQPDASCSTQSGGLSYDNNCTGSELGHAFYSELGGVAGQSLLATHNANYGLFSNIQDGTYWSGTIVASNPSNAWFFNTYGWQYNGGMGGTGYAWAVLSGNVPEPEIMGLLGVGAMAWVGARLRLRTGHRP